VLLYHDVGEGERGGDPRYAVTRAQLTGHLEQIREGGHPILSLASVCAYRGAAGAEPVALTFDDGRASDYEDAFPVLAAQGAIGEFFVNPGTMGHRGYLTWSQAREMARAGMRFQSHAHDHVYLTLLSPKLLERQVLDSKRRIEDEVGPVEFLAAPYGDFNQRVEQAVLAAGYRALCTSWNWPVRAGRRTISRVAIYGRTTPQELARLLRGDPLPYLRRAGRSALIYPAKRAVLRMWPERLTARFGSPA
jgi:peptidoglycan/xylan/chitin deacetylase (PgdA/CDA1 family)